MTNPEDKSSAAGSRSEFGEFGEEQSPECGGAEENYDERMSDSAEENSDGAEENYDEADELIGTVLNERYEILSRIGHGGMGVVYRGRHILMDKLVAIKVLSTNYINDESASLRFRHEAKVACQLSHPNIVAVHDFGISGKMPYLVMDFLEGETLSQILDDDSSVPSERAIDLIQQLCDALEYAHSDGLIHRDLKPSNMMIVKSKSGRDVVKVLDFGLAKFVIDGKAQKLTQTGQVFGTGCYMSPEQCSGKQADVRSDIYAVGCVLYETLTGLPPIAGENLLETFQKQIGEIPEPLAVIRPDLTIPDALQAIVSKALEKNPDMRYQSAAELNQALSSISASHSSGDFESGSHPIAQSGSAQSGSVQSGSVQSGSMQSGSVQLVSAQSGSVQSGSVQSGPVQADRAGVMVNSNRSEGAVEPTSNMVSSRPPQRDRSNRMMAPLPIGASIAVATILLTLAGWGSAYFSGINEGASSKVNPDRAVTIVADGENGTAKENWFRQFKEAQAAFDANKYADAESLLRRALAEARHTGDKSDLLVTLRKLEDVLYVQQKFQDADSLNKEIQRLSTPSNSNGGIVTLTTESDSSGTTVKESQNIPDRSISPPAEQDDRVAELAMFCHKKGQCTTATSLLEHALEISKKMYGPRSLKTADRMSELASLYLALEQKEKAQTLMKQVLDIKSHQNSKSK